MKLFDFYQVAWNDGTPRYGVVNNDDDAKREFAKGFLIVSDAILPVANRVAIAKVRTLKSEFGGEYDQYVQRAFEKATKHSDSLKGLRAGKLFGIGVGDGTAWYVVTRVDRQSVTVEWRGFCMDRYSDQVLGWGGAFPRRAIEPLVRRDEGLKAIFKKK